jgi:hypothetical protein
VIGCDRGQEPFDQPFEQELFDTGGFLQPLSERRRFPGWPPDIPSIECAAKATWWWSLLVIRIAGGGLALIAVFFVNQSVVGEEDFPIAGTYLRDTVCTGNGSQRPDLLVTITPKRIESPMGSCNILSRKRVGDAISAHVECKVPGDQLILGDVTFTIRDDKTLDFEDQDHTSDATLHRCPG